jgi:hypothetical protein
MALVTNTRETFEAAWVSSCKDEYIAQVRSAHAQSIHAIRTSSTGEHRPTLGFPSEFVPASSRISCRIDVVVSTELQVSPELGQRAVKLVSSLYIHEVSKELHT